MTRKPDREWAVGRLAVWLMLLSLPTPVWPAQTTANAPAETRWERQARQHRELTKDIVWFNHEPLAFLYRRGDHDTDEAERYRRMLAPENIKRMAAAGVRYGRLFFYKGFGLDFERPHIEQTRQAADLMHRLGMKVGLYMGGTMFIETFYREHPEARNWEQRDQDGQPVPYGNQTFRHYACPNEPAYRDYLKQVLKIGVEELHADEIAFDNLMLQPEPHSCRCPRCLAAFREFLRRRYPSRDAMMRRFGLPDADWVQVNEWESPAQPEGIAALNDPVLQEWVRFRCESLAAYSRDLHDYVKSLNPAVAVLFNIKGVYSFNRYWANAVYQPLFAGHMDLLSFDTGGYDARLDAKTGALVSQIRSFKLARQLRVSCEESMHDDLVTAVHMAFGCETPVAGYPGAPWFNGAHNVFSPILEFFREYHDRYYTGTENVADVAVLRNWPSMAYSISATYVSATLMEQVLIQHKVPFDLLFDEQLQHLERYGAVILAGQECVAEAQAQQLLAYVRGGGTLILAGNTGQYNEWRERRRVNPFLPARQEGQGRIVLLPEIIPGQTTAPRAPAADLDPEPGATPQRTPRMTPAQWVLPKNHEALYQQIVDSLPRGLSLTSDAPLTTVAEMVTRPSERQTLVHFVNFDRPHPVGAFRVTLRKQFPGAIQSVRWFSPETDDPVNLPCQESQGQVTFTVPALKLYTMLVVETAK